MVCLNIVLFQSGRIIRSFYLHRQIVLNSFIYWFSYQLFIFKMKETPLSICEKQTVIQGVKEGQVFLTGLVVVFRILLTLFTIHS